jgi:ABC-type multidrug transport system ATPase subunit
VANLEHADATMLANSTYLNTLSEDQLRKHVGYVPTEPHFLGTALVDELTLGRTNLAPWEPLATAFGLSTDSNMRPSECSRGERHRYALVRAMVAEPALLLLDEPTAGLGNDERHNLISALWASKATLVITTHDPDLIAKCDVVIPVEAFKG